VLVIPDLFPKFKGDVQGVFVLDYLWATQPYCNNTVLFVRLSGQKKGLVIEKEVEATVYRYCFTEKSVPSFLKPVYYLRWFLKGFSLGKELKDIDIIHSHGTILGGTLGYLLSKKLDKPLVITEHQGPFSMISGSFWKRNWARFTLQKADRVLVVSEHLKKEMLEAGIHPKEITVTYNPVDTELFSPSPDKKIKKNILFASRLDVFKGALRSLKAFHSIAAKYPDWSFTIVGEGGEFTALQEYITTHKLQPRVMLKGHKRKDELPTEMRNADFLVAPSLHESFGLVIAEALSCGIPVIAPNRTGPAEFVNEKCGLLVNPGSVEEIANAVERMIANLEEYDAVAIRNYVVEKFGIEELGKRIVNAYKS
jgi:glycosyltransferase involved in cell wall biosynthesis